jgi:hypothetical protein
MLERRIDQLRAEVRHAVARGDRGRAGALRSELRRAERDWHQASAHLDDLPAARDGGQRAAERPAPPRAAAQLLAIRDQAHQALTLLGAPAAARLVIAVHDAFFAGTLAAARLTSLRRDEERSFRAAPYARPYYLCAALTHDLLAPARGLLAVSTWPMERRVIGPVSPRVDYLTAAIRVAEGLARISNPGPAAVRLLWRFAINIPGAAESGKAMNPDIVAQAARAELAVHDDSDCAQRAAAARRACSQLDDVQQLFGSRLQAVGRAAAGS